MTDTSSSMRAAHFHLSDNTPANHLIGNVIVGYKRDGLFHRAVVMPEGLFIVTPAGELRTKGFLDRDAICHRFRCCAKDSCNLQLNIYTFDTNPTPQHIPVNLTIFDENDCPPVFSRDKIGGHIDVHEIHIPESTPIGATFKLPLAIDADSPKFRVRSYDFIFPHWNDMSIPNGSLKSFPFKLLQKFLNVGETPFLKPELKVIDLLDRETQPAYDIVLKAEDKGLPPLTGTTMLTIKILDENDHAPVFVNAITNITVFEDITSGTAIFTFDAHDLDEGQNAELFFSVDVATGYPETSEMDAVQLLRKFLIHETTGQLKLVQPLDYESEAERQFVLIVIVSDRGTPVQTASISFTVFVTDVNDNSPVINVLEADKSQSGMEPLVFYENDEEIHLLKLISVTDLDTISEGKLYCSLASANEASFQLIRYSSSMYGLSNKRAFDYEQDADINGYLNVLVQCDDHAEPVRSTQRRILIPLGDLNDNWPIFSRSNYQWRASEDTQIGTELGRVSATDSDSSHNSRLIYSVASNGPAGWNALLKVDPENGSIVLTAPLDREDANELRFLVTVSDCAVNTPETRQSTSLLNMTEQQCHPKFNTSGLIVVVTDVNDNFPSYLGPTEVHVAENSPIGTIVLANLTFVDDDLGENGTIHVFLQPLYEGKFQSILPKCPVQIQGGDRLVTTCNLDREVKDMWIIAIVAVDQGYVRKNTATVSFTIYVDDENDHPPQLIYPKNGTLINPSLANPVWSNMVESSGIPVDTARGTLVGTIQANDQDAGSNGTVSFSMLAQESMGPDKQHQFKDYPVDYFNVLDGFTYFHIDSKTGQIRTSWGQVEESKNASNPLPTRHELNPPEPGIYLLNIEICDHGEPPMTTNTLFFVNVSKSLSLTTGLNWLYEINMSNTVILIVIVMCSFVLVSSLIGAILWVRFKTTPVTETTPFPREFAPVAVVSSVCLSKWEQGLQTASTELPYNMHERKLAAYDVYDGYEYRPSPARQAITNGFLSVDDTLQASEKNYQHGVQPIPYTMGLTQEDLDSITMEGAGVSPAYVPVCGQYFTSGASETINFAGDGRGTISGVNYNGHIKNSNSTVGSDSGVDSNNGAFGSPNFGTLLGESLCCNLPFHSDVHSYAQGVSGQFNVQIPACFEQKLSTQGPSEHYFLGTAHQQTGHHVLSIPTSQSYLPQLSLPNTRL